FKLAEANTPPFYKTFTTGNWKRCRPAVGKEDCSVYGMNGITVNTNAQYNDFAIALQENFHHKYFKSIKVYHNFNPAYNFYIDYNSGLKYKHTEVKREGYSLYEFEENIDSVSFKVQKIDSLNSSEFTLYGFSLETEDPGFYYACMGFNGASCQSFIESQLLVPQLKSLSPDLVIFSIGVNDTHGPNFTKEYMVSHYDSLVAMVKRASPECAIIFTTVTDNYIKVRKARRRSAYVPNPKTLAAHEAILELSKKYNAGYWDLFMVMGGFKSMALWQKAGLAAKDKVHFSGGGYHIVGNLMFQAFVQSYYANSVLKKK
ncbi:MAG: hypothetical protein IAF38_21540, partial [Bacteroidia bacterium]|nr:hypothetical protein [Bacteroidia bacterium]